MQSREATTNKDFVFKYFPEVKTVAIRTETPSMFNQMSLIFFLELVIIYPWKWWNNGVPLRNT